MDSKANISVTFSLILILFFLACGLLMWVAVGPLVDQFYLVAHDNPDIMVDDNMNSLDIVYAAFQHPLLALLFACLIFAIVVATRTTDPNQRDDF